MSKLNEIVPPLELCKQIPGGEFEDSAHWYRWSYIDQKYLLDAGKPDVRLHREPCPCGMKYCYPAPTLQEILEDLKKLCVTPGIYCAHKNYWQAQCETLDDDGIFNYHLGGSRNPATAALILWLKLKGIEV